MPNRIATQKATDALLHVLRRIDARWRALDSVQSADGTFVVLKVSVVDASAPEGEAEDVVVLKGDHFEAGKLLLSEAIKSEIDGIEGELKTLAGTIADGTGPLPSGPVEELAPAEPVAA